MFDLDYATIHAAWDTYPRERVRYSEGEAGWVVRLDTQHVCVAHVPLTDDLFQFDVCVCPAGGGGDTLPVLGPVVQRCLTQQALVVYELPGHQATLGAHYDAFAQAVKAQGCVSNVPHASTQGFSHSRRPCSIARAGRVQAGLRRLLPRHASPSKPCRSLKVAGHLERMVAQHAKLEQSTKPKQGTQKP
jgi:hypothetical protein